MESFSALLALCAGKSPAPVNSPHKGQWRGALMFSLVCTWINVWVNNRESGDLRHRSHYDVNVMLFWADCQTRKRPQLSERTEYTPICTSRSTNLASWPGQSSISNSKVICSYCRVEPEINWHHFASICKCIFWNEIVWVSIKTLMPSDAYMRQ